MSKNSRNPASAIVCEEPPLRPFWRHAPPALNGGIWRFCLEPELYVPMQRSAWCVRYRGPHSHICDLAETDAVLAKIIEPRSRPRDDARKYVLSQARREFSSSHRLRRIGINTPEMLGWGISLTPGARYESALFMRSLPPFRSGLWVLRHEPDRAQRQQFLCQLAQELALLQGNGYIHKDCTFGNVCVLSEQRLVWIDSDIRRPRHIVGRQKGLRHALSLLKTTARDDLKASEWRLFKHELSGALAHWPTGLPLIDEIQ